MTLYELLGLIKDYEAPEKIEYDGDMFEYDKNMQDYYSDDYGEEGLFESLFGYKTDFLDDEVEVIEDDKIKKLDGDIVWCSDVVKKINEIIDVINERL